MQYFPFGVGGFMIKEEFSCVRDNLTIRGYVYRDENLNKPVVILSHGFMGTHKMCIDYAEYFCKKGYAAFIYDFNGGGIGSKSDGSVSDMTVLTEAEDLKAVINFASAQPYVNKDDITLVGLSQGGFVSAIVAAKLQDKIKRLIMFYPALCIPDDARKGSMIFAKFDPENVPEIVKCGPMKLGRCFVTDVNKLNANDEISGYKGPVLIIHGTKDRIVNIEYSKKAKEAYLEKRKDDPEAKEVRSLYIEGANHGFMGLKKKKWNAAAFSEIDRFL